jgi:hypothetical protein
LFVVPADHPDLGPELQQLATTIADALESIIQAALAAPSKADAKPGSCQNSWCPVCATAAVASGEQHPLITIVAERSTALMSLIRATVGPGPAASADAEASADEKSSTESHRYQHIDVTIID